MTSTADIAFLANELINATRAVQNAEENLKTLKEKERFLSEEAIPATLQSLGVSEIKLASGQKIIIKTEAFPSIRADKKQRAHAWLAGNGCDGIIKTEIKIPFVRGDKDKAEALNAKLLGLGYNANIKEDIHWQTLKAFVNERLSNTDLVDSLKLRLEKETDIEKKKEIEAEIKREELPEELFSPRVIDKTIIK